MGNSDGPPGPDQCYGDAVPWHDGQIHNLNDLVAGGPSMLLTEATDINNNGWIVGDGYVGPVRCGTDDVEHAFLLIPNARLVLNGLEVTQALQDLRNTIPLTEGKTTYVRAYVDWTGPGSRDTTGLLYGTRDGVPLPGSPLQPVDGSIAARAGSLDRRGTWRDSLDFLLPSSWTQGTVSLEFKLPSGDSTDLACAEAASVPGDCQASVQFQPVGELQVKLFQTRWSRTFGITGQLPVDTYTFQSTFGDVLRAVDALRAATPTAAVDWTTASIPIEPRGALAADTFLSDFLADVNRTLEYIRVLDGCLQGCNRIYAALVSAQVNGILIGVEGQASGIPGTAASVVVDPRPEQPARNILVHEVGHDLGLIHDVSSTLPSYETNGNTPLDAYGDPFRQGPCGELAGAQKASEPRTADYPYFDQIPGTQSYLYDGDPVTTPGIRPVFGPPNAAVDDQLYGIDASLIDSQPSDAVFDPKHVFDLMSYCGAVPPGPPNGWAAGEFTYDALRTALDARFPAPSLRRLSRARRASSATTYLVMRGSIDVATNAVTFSPFGSITTSQTVPVSDGPFTANALDASGNVIAHAAFSVALGHGDPTPGAQPPQTPASGDFLVLLPNATDAARVEIVREGAVIGSASASAHRPTVSIDSASPTDVRWSASDADGDPLTAAIEYSGDGGTTWSALGVDVAGNEYSVDSSQLPGSNDALFRVVVSDGFQTAAATSRPFVVGGHAPLLAVQAPGNGAVYTPDQAISLVSDAYDVEDGALTGASIRWTVDGAGVGTGADAVVEARSLAAGPHTVRVTATDSTGTQTAVTRQISIGSVSDPGTIDASAVGGGRQAPVAQPQAPAAPAAPTSPAAPATAHVSTLALALAASPTSPRAAVPFTLSRVVANGAEPATGVTYVETLPPGVTFSSVTTTRGTCSADVVITCYVGTLPAGGRATIDIAATASAAGVYSTTASVTDEFGAAQSASSMLVVRRNAPPQLALPGGAFTPPLQARRVGKAAVLSAAVMVGEPATIGVRAGLPHGAALSLLRGSFVGATVEATKAKRLDGSVAAGTVEIHLRLNGAALRPRATYRITITATDDQLLTSTLTIPFTVDRG